MRCLLLTFDCLPRRWIGCYGSLDHATRGFDRLAALGTVFENAISTNVRAGSGEMAGFSLAGDKLAAPGRELTIGTHLITSADDSSPSRKGRKRAAGSHLAAELHQACDWMRQRPGQSLACVRHPGLRLGSDPLVGAEQLEDVLSQLSILDEEIDAFLDEWLDCADERWTLVVTAGRGVIRPRESVRRRDEKKNDPLRFSDDLIRVPLLTLEGRGEGFGRRHLPLLPTTRLAEAVHEASVANSHEVVSRLRTGPAVESILVEGDGGLAVRTADWLFVRSLEQDREPGDGQLFRKPEDVCDVFDVRSTHAEVAVRLDELATVQPEA